MDKEFLLRLDTNMQKIKTNLLISENVRNLLFNDSETNFIPSIEQMEEYIFTQPIIDVGSEPPYNKKNYITITMPNARQDYDELSINYTMRIMVMCDKQTWMYEGKQRPLLLGQEIVNILNHLMIDSSHSLVFQNFCETVTNKDVAGYSFLFSLRDGTADEDK